VRLTEGYSIAPGSWAVSLAALPELKIMLPAGTTGRSEIVVTLVSIDGAVLAETKSTLAISAASQRTGNLVTRDAGPPAAASILRAGVGEGTERSGQPPQPVTQPSVPQERERALRLVKKGDEQLAEGNIAAARLFYERAADAGLAEAPWRWRARSTPRSLRDWACTASSPTPSRRGAGTSAPSSSAQRRRGAPAPDRHTHQLMATQRRSRRTPPHGVFWRQPQYR